jgi:hypothetical protein
MLGGKSNLIKILTLLLLVLFSIEAGAQGSNFRDKIEKIKLEKLIKKLNLDENTAQTFSEKYKAFAGKIKELNKKRFIAYKLMGENLESGNGLDTLVNQVIDYEDEINKERMSFAEEMKVMLTPRQLATMIIFERKFNIEIRKLLKDLAKDKKKTKD